MEKKNTIEGILVTRFGNIDEELQGIISPLLKLPSLEMIPFLLNLSRQELIDRFCDKS
jgi:hypothetical protein